MYARLVIEFPTTGTGIPIVDMNKMLKQITPALHHAVAEANPQGQTLIRINEHMTDDYPAIEVRVNWRINLHAEIGQTPVKA